MKNRVLNYFLLLVMKNINFSSIIGYEIIEFSIIGYEMLIIGYEISIIGYEIDFITNN